MKTDDLIDMLASGPDLAAPKIPVRRFILLVATGFLASVLLMLALLGVRSNFDEMATLPAFWVKIVFVIALASAGGIVAARLSMPGARTSMLPVLIAAPLLLIWIAAAVSLMHAAPGERSHLFWGDTWRYCTLLITLLSLPIFAAVLQIMRQLAPTRLHLAGAGAGFAAGAAAIVVYSMHCPEIAAPFLGFWYVLGAAIPTILGALIGPRILRW
ncbi:NrsF family protein [Oxalicibacterium solurbis]|uniref:DUF1109 domain-containing protein n=1 Tax=Oxalicibacterium solurbis TaxID=69280 RepID=A0A8J3F4Y9_9BURK|nr:DUF1109 domain-containing protein [Oxalicibacterium solurbis]GGI54977.1 hypothetical protein GCM10011430_21510 [Oxalicibacterium solurbis]